MTVDPQAPVRAALERLRTFSAHAPEGLFTACGFAYHGCATADEARVKLSDDLAAVLVQFAALCTVSQKRRDPIIGPADETAWLVEETWSGHIHYVHKDFSAIKWAAECRLDKERGAYGLMSRMRAPFITKNLDEAMRFTAKADAQRWLASQPKWMSRGDQYEVREHVWPPAAPEPSTPQERPSGEEVVGLVAELRARANALHRSAEPSPTALLCAKAADLLERLALQPAGPGVGERETFQDRVQPWMQECFGPEIAADKLERGDRLLEETLELLQSGGYPPDRVAALVEYTYSRPVGEPCQEVGGVMVCVAAYCLAHGLNMHAAAEVELARVWTKVPQIRAKQATKAATIPFSPLPAISTPGDAQASGEAGLNYVQSPECLAEIEAIERQNVANASGLRDFVVGGAHPQSKPFRCKAGISYGGSDPQDCDWPQCGCDPAATAVLDALEEQGLRLVSDRPSAIPSQEEWRPIETAPKDGTDFLAAYSSGRVGTAFYLDNSHTAHPWAGFRPRHGAERWDDKFTHWRPLPAPPAPEHGCEPAEVAG